MLLEKGRVMYAKKDYVLGDYSNPDIHDTHIKTSEKCLYIPDDLARFRTYSGNPITYSEYEHIVECAKLVLQKSFEILISRYTGGKWSYPEAQCGSYEVFGCDFMIDTSVSPPIPYLLEINDRISNMPATGENDVYDIITTNEGKDVYKWDLVGCDPSTRRNLWRHADFSRTVWENVVNFAIAPMLNYDIPYTFIISGNNGIDHAPLRNLLRSKGFVELDITAITERDCVGLIIQEKELRNGKVTFDKRVYPIRNYAKSIISDQKDCITNKWKLYENFCKLGYSHYVAKSYLANSGVTQTYDVSIVKPVSIPGYFIGGGDGILVTESQDDIGQHIQHLNSRYPSNPVIVSEYITQPLTLENRKMHFRMYLLVTVYGNVITSKLWHQGKILTAKLPYINASYNTRDIHDSHIGSTPQDYYIDFNYSYQYPNDLDHNLIREIFDGMEKCAKVIDLIVKEHNIQPYAESRCAYELFGLDFMYNKATRRLVLLEVNDNIGIDKISQEDNLHSMFSEELWEFIYDNSISYIWNMTRPKYATYYYNAFISYISRIFPKTDVTNSKLRELFDYAVYREYGNSVLPVIFDDVVKCVISNFAENDEYALRSAKETVKDITTKYRKYANVGVSNITIIGHKDNRMSNALASAFRISDCCVTTTQDILELNIHNLSMNIIIVDLYNFVLGQDAIGTLSSILHDDGLLFIKGYNEVQYEDEKKYYNTLIELSEYLHRYKLGIEYHEPCFSSKEYTISTLEVYGGLGVIHYEEKPGPQRKYLGIFKKIK
jgi:hypothetical protein